MKATGIVRRIDDLGRVVIPKEIRRTMRIREGDPLEIYTSKDGEVIFRKYSPMGGLNEFAAQICDSLQKTTGHPVLVTDRDTVIAVAGLNKRDWVEKPISSALEQLMEERKLYQHLSNAAPVPVTDLNQAVNVQIAAPILTEGDLMGCVLFAGTADEPPVGETEYKLAQTVSSFLGRHMES